MMHKNSTTTVETPGVPDAKQLSSSVLSHLVSPFSRPPRKRMSSMTRTVQFATSAWVRCRRNGTQSKIIVKALEAAVPTIVSLREEAQKQAEIEHQRWEAQWREYEKQEQERRRTQALKESREQLIAIVEAWSFARSFDSFFEGMQQRVSTLPAEQRDAVLGRIAQARAMLGGTDALTTFKSGSHRTNDERKATDSLRKRKMCVPDVPG